MTGQKRYTANAQQSYTLASRTSQRTEQSLPKSKSANSKADVQTDELKEQRTANI